MNARRQTLLTLVVASAGCSLTLEFHSPHEAAPVAPIAPTRAHEGPVKLALPPPADPQLDARQPATRRRQPQHVLVSRGAANVLAVVYADAIAVSTDDGQRWRERPLPAGFAGHTAAIDETGAILWTDTELRALAYDATDARTLHGRCVNARFALSGSSIALACAGERSDEDTFERSDDSGRTWRTVLAPPMSHHTDRLEFDSRGNIQQTWSWSAGCGGGGGGRSQLARGDASWKELPTPLQWDTAQIGADGWSYNVELQRDHHFDRSVIVARESGEDRVVAYVPGRSWRASSFNGTITALLIDDVIVSLDGPRVFRVVRAPEGASNITVDAQRRILAATDRGVLRHSEPTGWQRIDDAVAQR